MGKELRWRIILILVIVGACLWAIIPPKQKIKLGLDLKGGAHMVLRVETDDALRLETETTAERLRDSLDKAGITGANIAAPSPEQFTVTNVPPAQDGLFRTTAAEVETTYDRSGGANGSYTFTMKPNYVKQLRDDTIT